MHSHRIIFSFRHHQKLIIRLNSRQPKQCLLLHTNRQRPLIALVRLSNSPHLCFNKLNLKVLWCQFITLLKLIISNLN